jgi:hypothetical protein
MLRSGVMRPCLRTLPAFALALCLASAATAQSTPPDSSLLVVFERDVPVAHERSRIRDMGDSLVVEATAERTFRDEKGGRHPFRKTMVLVVDSRDLVLIRYVSNQDFNGHQIVLGLVPGDTSMTYYSEIDGAGEADRLVQPPGRLFVLDSQLFSLFDVLCRSLAGKTFTTRRVQLLALRPGKLSTPLATLTFEGRDTLALGGAKLVAKHYAMEDSSARFEIWADPQGRLARLTHAESELRVERMPEPGPAPAKKSPASTKPVKKLSSASAH